MIDGDEAGVIKTGRQRLELCYVAQGGDGSLAVNLTTSRSDTTLAKPREVVSGTRDMLQSRPGRRWSNGIESGNLAGHGSKEKQCGKHSKTTAVNVG